jgi:hypothetical protein
MSKPKEHSILQSPWQYDVEDFHYHVDRNNPDKSYIDMNLRKDEVLVKLRFHRPVNLKIEAGFPNATRGMVFYDVASDFLENIGVEVADFEASQGSVTFSAKSVERL